jgi:hypothetical protein
MIRVLIALVLLTSVYATPVQVLEANDEHIVWQPQGAAYVVQCRFGQMLNCIATAVPEKEPEPVSSQRIYLQ